MNINLNVRVKFWFFAYYWYILVSMLILILWLFIKKNESLASIATMSGVILSIGYFVQKQKIEELRIFMEVFKECNSRYEALRKSIIEITKKSPIDLTEYERETVVSYLNLCGEEYLYFKQGYIEPSVWSAWHKGMKSVVSAKSISSIWEQEKKTGSYYDLPL